MSSFKGNLKDRVVYHYYVKITVDGRVFEGFEHARRPFTAANRLWNRAKKTIWKRHQCLADDIFCEIRRGKKFCRMSKIKVYPQLFVLFDARARSLDTDDAAVLDTAYSEQDARATGGYPADSIWFEYKLKPGATDDYEEVGPRYDITC